MKKQFQKIIAISVVTTSLLAFSHEALASTASIDTTNTFIGSDNVVYEKIPEVTPEEFQKALDKVIQKQAEKIQDSKNGGTVVVNVNEDGGVEGGGALLLPSDSWVPNIKIQNQYVVSAVNTIIDATLVSIGVGSVSVALQRYGSQQLRLLFTANLKTRIFGKGAIALGGSLATIVDYILDFTSPGTYAANYLDSIDCDPNNGYLDIIW